MRLILVALAAVVVWSSDAAATYTYSSPSTQFVPGSTVASQQVLAVATQTAVQTLSGRGAAALRGSPATRSGGNDATAAAYGRNALGGAAAGDPTTGYGVWTSLSSTGFSDDNSATQMEGRVWSMFAGVDRKLGDDILLGLAFNGDVVSIDTTFNGGTVKGYGFGVMPYVGYAIDDAFSLNGAAGWSFQNLDNTRVANGTTVTGEAEGGRWFATVSGDYFRSIGDFGIAASANLIWSQSRTDAFTESNGNRVGAVTTDTGAFGLSVSPSYLIEVDRDAGFYLEPFVRGSWSWEFARDDIRVGPTDAAHANDADRFGIGGGTSLYLGEDLSATFEAETTLGLEDQRGTSVSGTVRYQF